jgi:hypothetical protein
MQALAPTGSIAISEQTRKLIEGYFALKPLGPARVKGVTEPVNVYEVTGLGPLRTRLQRAAGRGLTKFVGREREIEALNHAAERARSGRGQIVAAIAEAGTGKSRLFFEFKAKNQSGWTVLDAFSVSHGRRRHISRLSICCRGISESAPTMTHAPGVRSSTARFSHLIVRLKTPCPTCSPCSVSPRVMTRWRRWTGK